MGGLRKCARVGHVVAVADEEAARENREVCRTILDAPASAWTLGYRQLIAGVC